MAERSRSRHLRAFSGRFYISTRRIVQSTLALRVTFHLSQRLRPGNEADLDNAREAGEHQSVPERSMHLGGEHQGLGVLGHRPAG